MQIRYLFYKLNTNYNLILLLILTLAFGLRIWGLDFGLPYKFHPDEDKYVDVALNWYLQGEANLEFINPPLFIYILRGAYGLWLVCSPFSPTDQWISGAYFFARWWSVAFSLLTIALAYRVTQYLSHRQAGLLAAGLLTGLFLPIREAHFAVNDTAVTFFVLLAIYMSLRILPDYRLTAYLLAGCAIGLATATKLTGALTILPLLIAYVLSIKNHNGLGILISLVSACSVFLLIDIHIFWEWSLFVEAITKHVDFGLAGYKGLQMMPRTGWEFYLYELYWGLGWPLTWAILATLAHTLFYPHRKTNFRFSYGGELVLLVLPVTLFIYMGAQKIVFARFLLPAIPPLIIFTAIKLHQGMTHFHLVTKPLWLFSLTILLAQPVATSLWFDHLLTLPDTRQMATDWFRQTFPKEITVASESYSILPSKVLLETKWPYKIKNLSASKQISMGLKRYLSSPADIVVLSNYTSERIYEREDEEILRREQLALLNSQATLIKEFNPYIAYYDGWFYLDQIYGPADETWFRLRPGPIIKIYQVKSKKQEIN